MPCTVDVNDATGSPPTQGVSCSQEVEQPESIFLSSPPVGRGLKCYCEQRFICANPFAPPHGARVEALFCVRDFGLSLVRPSRGA